MKGTEPFLQLLDATNQESTKQGENVGQSETPKENSDDLQKCLPKTISVRPSLPVGDDNNVRHDGSLTSLTGVSSQEGTSPSLKSSAGKSSGDKIPGPRFPWSKFRPNMFLSYFSLTLQLVLLGAGGSFLFGFCLANLNTATNAINSSFLQCGDGKFFTRYHGITPDVCTRYPDCRKHCARFEDKLNTTQITSVMCPGGYNDISCPSLKWYNAFLTTSVLIGATIGCLTGSRLLASGRRLVLLATMGIFLVGTVTCTVANSFSAIVWGRLIVGYAVGLVSVASPTYMSEVTPKDLRGSYGVAHQLGIVIGIFLPFLLGLPLVDPAAQNDAWVPSTFQEFWWRFMVAIAILPTLFVLYLLMFVYTFETPVYYVEQRRFKDAASLLELIHGKEDIKEELDGVIDNVRQGEISKEHGMSFTAAFGYPEYRHVIMVGILLSAFQQFGGINVFVTSSSDIFRKAGLSGFMQTLLSVVMGLINIIMTFPTLFLIEIMGRRSLMLIGSALQTAAVLPAALMYWIDKDAFITQIFAIIGVLGFVTFFALAYGPILWVYLFEIYPMEIKDVAAGVATAANWICGVIMVFVSSLLPNQISYSVFAGLQLVGTLIIFFLMKETKGLPLGESPFITKKVQV